MNFLKRVLRQHSLLEAHDEIICVSARDGLAAKQNGAWRALELSGMPALEHRLVQTLAREKRLLLAEATRGKAGGILGAAMAEVELRHRALTVPLAELAEKARAFQAALGTIEQRRRAVQHLLDGDRRRLQLVLDLRIGDLRRRIMATLSGIVDASLADHPPAEWEEATRRALAAATEKEFTVAREPLAAGSAADFEAALTACRERIDPLVAEVRRTAAQLFDMPSVAGAEPQAFALAEDPYWLTESKRVTIIPDPSPLVDRLLPARIRRSRLRARIIGEIGEMLIRNCENLRWAIWRGLDEAFRRAAAQFDEELDATMTGTRALIEAALARRRDQESTVQAEIERLFHAGEMLARLRKELEQTGPAYAAGTLPVRSGYPTTEK